VGKEAIDFFTAGDIRQDITRVESIINTNIFAPQHAFHPLVKSAFTEVMVCLNDLTHKTEKFASRICFTNDMVVTTHVKDVTALIRFVRDAMCHIHIYNHFIVPDRIKASFFVLYGKHRIQPFLPDHDVALVSDYADDICFFFGLHKIYLRRHIVRVHEEVKRRLLPLPEFPNDIIQDGLSNR
jgi:hypothetical protein